MSLPAITYSQVDFSAGQITGKAARRDDVKLQRSGLRQSVNTRPLSTGALAQRFGRAAYDTGTGRSEIVRFSDTEIYEFLIGAGTLTIKDSDLTVLNTFSSLPWSLATMDEVVLTVAEREVFINFRNTRPWRLKLGVSGVITAEAPATDMLDNLAYPTLGSFSNGTHTSTSTTSHTTSLPSGIQPGDLLILFFRCMTADATYEGPDGWTSLDSYVSATAKGQSEIWYKEATGEDDAPTVVTSLGGRSAWIIHRVVDWSDIEGAFASSDTFDPPSLSPSWGSNRNYWNIFGSHRQCRNQVPNTPSDYSRVAERRTNGTNATSSNAHGGMITAEDDEETGTENPGAFTEDGAFGDNVDLHAATVAVKPDEEAEALKAFDGVNSKASGACITKDTDDEAIIYLDLTDDPKAIESVTVRGSNDQGFVNGATPSVTIKLYGKDGSVPTIASPGTELGTSTFTDTADESGGRAVNSSDTTTEYDYVAVVITHDGSDADMYVAQVSLLEPAPDNDAWEIEAFSFETTSSGAKRQPYHRYAPRGITMLPGARTGTGQAVTFSDPVLAAGHVGTSFRFHGAEVVIASVTDAVSGTIDIVDKLPPMRRVACTDANGRDGFRIGQVVVGVTSAAEGIVVALNSTTNLDVIMLKGDNFVASERIVSETGNTAVSGTPSEQTLVASTVWDEALMSTYRGWPASATYDRSRLIFCDFPQLPRAIAWSAVGVPSDFKQGADADDGFVEFATGTGRVRHVLGGADQYVLTDTAAMYIPVSEANPLAPGSVVFRPISALGTSPVRPVLMHEGLVYVTKSGNALQAIVPTGQTAFPYRTAAISEFHADLFQSVTALAAMTGGGDEAEQYLWALLADGTAVVGRFDPSNEWAGFSPVTGSGTIKWISSLAGDVRFNVQYQADGSAVPWVIELLDETQYVDGGVPVNLGTPALRPTPDAGEGRLWMYADLNVELMDGDEYLGQRAVDSDGNITELTGDDFDALPDLVAGFAFTVTVEPYLPNMPEGPERGQRMRRRRVKRASATVEDATKFTFLGRSFGASDATLSDQVRASQAGRAFDPSMTLVKSEPGPITLLELAASVTV